MAIPFLRQWGVYGGGFRRDSPSYDCVVHVHIYHVHHILISNSLPASRGEQHFLDISYSCEVQQHVHMLIPLQLLQKHRLFLLSYPPPTLHSALKVYSPVPVAVQHSGLHVGELVRVLEGHWRGDAAAIQAVDDHARRCEVINQRLCVLTHIPAILEINVWVEPLVVLYCVIGSRRLNQDLKEGGGGDGKVSLTYLIWLFPANDKEKLDRLTQSFNKELYIRI